MPVEFLKPFVNALMDRLKPGRNGKGRRLRKLGKSKAHKLTLSSTPHRK
jgi:hypothetical protein